MALTSSGSCKCCTLPLAAIMLCLMSLLHIFLPTSSLKRCGFTIANSGEMMRGQHQVRFGRHTSGHDTTHEYVGLDKVLHATSCQRCERMIERTHLEGLEALAVAQDLAGGGCQQCKMMKTACLKSLRPTYIPVGIGATRSELRMPCSCSNC